MAIGASPWAAALLLAAVSAIGVAQDTKIPVTEELAVVVGGAENDTDGAVVEELGAGVAVGAAAPGAPASTVDPSNPRAANYKHKGFIRVQNMKFVDEECNEFFMAGWNSWGLIEMATEILMDPENALLVEGKNQIVWLFDEAIKNGFNTVRLFGHTVKPWLTMQLAPGTYDERVFRGLDYVLSEAGKRGLKLIISFATNWKTIGSKGQFARWDLGAETPDHFFTSPYSRLIYTNHMKAVATRMNTFTGVLYKDDPVIFAWNLFNEVRCRKPFCWEQDATLSWNREMAQFLKGVDPNHMITTGQEGFYGWGCPDGLEANPNRKFVFTGQDFIRDHSIPEIDFAVIHLWSDNWDRGSDIPYAQDWIRQHAKDAEKYIKKPLVLEEFGVQTADDDAERMSVRDPYFRAIFSEVEASLQSGGVLRGALFWEWRPFKVDKNRMLTSKHKIVDEHSTWSIITAHVDVVARYNEGPKAASCTPGQGSDVVTSVDPNNRYDINSCCDGDCNAQWAEVVGEVVLTSVTTTAGECCNACKEANADGNSPNCDAWSWCSCGNCGSGASKGTCWIKQLKNPVYPRTIEIGVQQSWVSGVLGPWKYPEWQCQPSGQCALDENCPDFEASIQCVDLNKCGGGQFNANSPTTMITFSVNAGAATPFTPATPPLVTTAAECCAVCLDNPECNAWRFCPDPDGCSLYRRSCTEDRSDLGPYETCAPNGRNYPQYLCSLFKSMNPYDANPRTAPAEEFVSGFVPGRV